MSDESNSHAVDAMVRALPPSHILQDGRFVHLPPLSNAERARFLERSIAKHGLLHQDLQQQQETTESEEETSKEEKDESASALKIHPLAVASARLNANGISELSKAINLAGLVSTGEYFGLSNIVDPSLEIDKKKDSASTTQKPTVDAVDTRLRSTFLCKRKRSQFQQAADFMEQQSHRLANAMTAQSVVDDRLVGIRKSWRLVAPEHGTRARPHAVRPTEVVAVDVHVYDRDRTGGGNQALLLKEDGNDMLGRIARRVPRYATVELDDTYSVSKHVDEWKQGAIPQEDGNVIMSDAEKAQQDESCCQTRCEPFAVADPTLGKIDVDFDPDKVPMLTLELTITKASTGFHQSACLPPISGQEESKEDEKVVEALQHSLFCASLFESIRKELSFDDEHQQRQEQCWLSSEAEETFLPPPSKMAGSIYNGDVASLCVVHCHEGEVKVQLDSEYVLTVKLVEATAEESSMDTSPTSSGTSSSGSQSPAQLHVLCRALLLHIQDVYHTHCIKTRPKMQQEEKGDTAPGLARVKKKSVIPSPHILQNCVSLGAKMLFEGKVRRALKRVSKWLKNEMHSDEPLVVEWLALSMFDLQSHFALSFRDFSVNVSIDRDGMSVTGFGQEESYKSVNYNSDVEFELYLKFEIRKRFKVA